MNRLVRVLLVLGVVLGMSGQALAAPVAAIDKGIGGVAWGAYPAKTQGFMKLKTLDGMDYFVNLRERLTIRGFAKPTVFYGALDGRLYAAHLRLKESGAYPALKAQLTAVYGPGKQKREDGGKVTRWKAGHVRVKLKLDAGGETKLSFYYQPVAVTLAKGAREADPGQDLVNLLAKDGGPADPSGKAGEPAEGVDLMSLLKKVGQ